jgi:hypothetical protein
MSSSTHDSGTEWLAITGCMLQKSASVIIVGVEAVEHRLGHMA